MVLLLRFVTFLVTLYSSFARYEEAAKLTISDVLREGTGFVLNFRKEKSYQWNESHIGVVTDLHLIEFNPGKILLHANSSHSSNLLFTSCRVFLGNEVSLSHPM